jgi:hypothetical protein
MEVTFRRICPQIIYIQGIHITVADAIFQLEHNSKLNISNDYAHTMLGVPSEKMSLRR